MKQAAALYVHANDSAPDDPALESRCFEIRMSVDADRKPIIEGHAAVFNQPSLEIFPFAPGWREIIRPGAFARAIKSNDVRALINHNMDKLIGRVSNGTLALEEDDVGLKVRIYPPDTTEARDLLELIRGRYITQMSFGFTTDQENIDATNKYREILTVKKLYDVSPVTEPAYPQTDVGLRSRIDALSLPEDKDFAERMKARDDFLARRSPRPDPLSLTEILRSARKTYQP